MDEDGELEVEDVLLAYQHLGAEIVCGMAKAIMEGKPQEAIEVWGPKASQLVKDGPIRTLDDRLTGFALAAAGVVMYLSKELAAARSGPGLDVLTSYLNDRPTSGQS